MIKKPRVNVQGPNIAGKVRWIVCCGSAAIFLGILMIIGWPRRDGTNPICNSPMQYSSWVATANMFVSSAFIATAVNQIIRINVSTFHTHENFDTLLNFYAAFCVNAISGTGTIFTYVLDWGGTCVSIYGVPMSACLFPEWIVTVPLMTYIMESTTDEYLHRWRDRIPVIGQFLSILFGFLGHLSRTQVQMLLCLTLSLCCAMTGPYAWFLSELECERLYKRLERTSRLRSEVKRRLSMFARKRSLAAVIAFMFPVFPTVYFLRMFGWISDDVTFVGFLVASNVTKSVFSALCMDSHLEVSHPMANTLAAEEYANQARRSFLRYIFHEVRGALNVVSIGAGLLEGSDDGASSSDTETVKKIRDASLSMVETLNNAQLLQHIEEGSLELHYEPFTV